jgi:hypothetical protein
MDRLTPQLTSDRKFAVIAVSNIFTNIAEPLTSSVDYTIVSNKLPFVLEDHWRDWLGKIQYDNLSGCNLFIERYCESGWTANQLENVDGFSESLKGEVYALFGLLHLLGNWEYDRANVYLFSGYVKDGFARVRQFTRPDRFQITRDYTKSELTAQSIDDALALHRAFEDLKTRLPENERARFWRGFRALFYGLKAFYASDRLHGFVRSLEALILPEKSNTEKQFRDRCAIMAARDTEEAKARQMLGEAYKLRSDVEHVNEWDKSLTALPDASAREQRALWRTRQVEALAFAAYRRILLDPNVQRHFMSDADIRALWEPSNVTNARAAIGNVCDITTIK